MIKHIFITLMLIAAIIPFVFAADANTTKSPEYSISIEADGSWSGEYGILGEDQDSASDVGSSLIELGELPTGTTFEINFKKLSDVSDEVGFAYDKNNLKVSLLKDDKVLKSSSTTDPNGMVFFMVTI